MDRDKEIARQLAAIDRACAQSPYKGIRTGNTLRTQGQEVVDLLADVRNAQGETR